MTFPHEGAGAETGPDPGNEWTAWNTPDSGSDPAGSEVQANDEASRGYATNPADTGPTGSPGDAVGVNPGFLDNDAPDGSPEDETGQPTPDYHPAKPAAQPEQTTGPEAAGGELLVTQAEGAGGGWWARAVSPAAGPVTHSEARAWPGPDTAPAPETTAGDDTSRQDAAHQQPAGDAPATRPEVRDYEEIPGGPGEAAGEQPGVAADAVREGSDRTEADDPATGQEDLRASDIELRRGRSPAARSADVGQTALAAANEADAADTRGPQEPNPAALADATGRDLGKGPWLDEELEARYGSIRRTVVTAQLGVMNATDSVADKINDLKGRVDEIIDRAGAKVADRMPTPVRKIAGRVLRAYQNGPGERSIRKITERHDKRMYNREEKRKLIAGGFTHAQRRHMKHDRKAMYNGGKPHQTRGMRLTGYTPPPGSSSRSGKRPVPPAAGERSRAAQKSYKRYGQGR